MPTTPLECARECVHVTGAVRDGVDCRIEAKFVQRREVTATIADESRDARRKVIRSEAPINDRDVVAAVVGGVRDRSAHERCSTRN